MFSNQRVCNVTSLGTLHTYIGYVLKWHLYWSETFWNEVNM